MLARQLNWTVEQRNSCRLIPVLKVPCYNNNTVHLVRKGQKLICAMVGQGLICDDMIFYFNFRFTVEDKKVCVADSDPHQIYTISSLVPYYTLLLYVRVWFQSIIGVATNLQAETYRSWLGELNKTKMLVLTEATVVWRLDAYKWSERKILLLLYHMAS